MKSLAQDLHSWLKILFDYPSKRTTQLHLKRICPIEVYVPAGKRLRFQLPDDTSSYIQAFFSHQGYHYLLVPAVLAIAPESLAASFPPQPRAWRKDLPSFCFSSCQEQPQFWEGQFHRGLSSSITLRLQVLLAINYGIHLLSLWTTMDSSSSSLLLQSTPPRLLWQGFRRFWRARSCSGLSKMDILDAKRGEVTEFFCSLYSYPKLVIFFVTR